MKQTIELITVILMAHMFGDYFLQTDYLAMNKGKDNYILLAHSILYSLGIGVVFGIFGIYLSGIELFIVATIHFPVDYIKARGISTKIFGYKKALLLDQIIHYITLLLILVLK